MKKAIEILKLELKKYKALVKAFRDPITHEPINKEVSEYYAHVVTELKQAIIILDITDKSKDK